jgi:hypothetical protein
MPPSPPIMPIGFCWMHGWRMPMAVCSEDLCLMRQLRFRDVVRVMSAARVMMMAQVPKNVTLRLGAGSRAVSGAIRIPCIAALGRLPIPTAQDLPSCHPPSLSTFSPPK